MTKLAEKIEKKLVALEKVIEKIRNKVIDSDDSEMWDSSYYYDLASKLKEALGLLQNKQANKLDDWGEPIILETGLLSLLDDWETEKEETEN